MEVDNDTNLETHFKQFFDFEAENNGNNDNGLFCQINNILNNDNQHIGYDQCWNEIYKLYETLEYVEIAMNQLIKKGYTETRQCFFEYEDLCNVLEISIEWINNL